MDKLINAAKAPIISDDIASETLKKRLPSKALDGRVVCIIDEVFCDIYDNLGFEEKVELNPYRIYVENDTEDYSNWKDILVNLIPYKVYGYEVNNNELMLLNSDYVWVYDEVEFIDDFTDYFVRCKINLTVARKVTDKNGSEILVDVEESEFKENVRVFKSLDLAVKCIEDHIHIWRYKLDPTKEFDVNSVEHITIKNLEYLCDDSKIKFLKTRVDFLENINSINDILDKNTFIYVVPNHMFNWSVEDDVLGNCGIKWNENPPKLFSLDGLILVLIMCLDKYYLDELLS